MCTPKELYYQKRGALLVKNLKSRHFDAWYCANKEEALKKAGYTAIHHTKDYEEKMKKSLENMQRRLDRWHLING